VVGRPWWRAEVTPAAAASSRIGSRIDRLRDRSLVSIIIHNQPDPPTLLEASSHPTQAPPCRSSGITSELRIRRQTAKSSDLLCDTAPAHQSAPQRRRLNEDLDTNRRLESKRLLPRKNCCRHTSTETKRNNKLVCACFYGSGISERTTEAQIEDRTQTVLASRR